MRNMIGYGLENHDLYWPNKAKVAINFVINYEEGSELSPYGDVGRFASSLKWQASTLSGA